MALFSKLFGKSAEQRAEPEIYKDFLIFPEPVKDGADWRIAARIEKDIAGDVKVHKLVRADTLNSKEAAQEASLFKAKQMIDQVGDRLFDS